MTRHDMSTERMRGRMTRKGTARLWRVVLVGETKPTTYLVYAETADDAADQAEHSTGLDAAICDDITPASWKRSSSRRPAGLLS